MIPAMTDESQSMRDSVPSHPRIRAREGWRNLCDARGLTAYDTQGDEDVYPRSRGDG
jgi:hypothetical protein